MRKSIFFILIGSLMVLCFSLGEAQAQWPRIVPSKDGTPVSYEVYGTGEPTLVFVHGWCCDSRYWRNQVAYFSQKYRVVMLDLAGHGHSGMTRKTYSMASFGEDVRAVTEAAGNCGANNSRPSAEAAARVALASSCALSTSFSRPIDLM